MPRQRVTTAVSVRTSTARRFELLAGALSSAQLLLQLLEEGWSDERGQAPAPAQTWPRPLMQATTRIPVSIPAHLAARVDEARGSRPIATYLRDVVESFVAAHIEDHRARGPLPGATPHDAQLGSRVPDAIAYLLELLTAEELHALTWQAVTMNHELGVVQLTLPSLGWTQHALDDSAWEHLRTLRAWSKDPAPSAPVFAATRTSVSPASAAWVEQVAAVALYARQLTTSELSLAAEFVKHRAEAIGDVAASQESAVVLRRLADDNATPRGWKAVKAPSKTLAEKGLALPGCKCAPKKWRLRSSKERGASGARRHVRFSRGLDWLLNGPWGRADACVSTPRLTPTRAALRKFFE